MRQRWWLAAVLPIIGAIIGFLVAAMLPTTYTAESRVAVGKGDLSSGAIAGFPVAAASLASNYARYVNDSGVAGQTEVPEGVTMAASEIPDSSVVRIEATSKDQDQAVAAAQKTAEDLVKQVNGSQAEGSPQTALADYNKIAAQWAAAQTASNAAADRVGKLSGTGSSATALAEARKTYEDAQVKLASLAVQKEALSQKYQNMVANSSTAADLTLVKKAEVTASDKSSREQTLALIGLVLGLGLALLLAARAARRENRRATRVERVERTDSTVRTERTDGVVERTDGTAGVETTPRSQATSRR
nr:hypothetical protein [Arsenicicoccus piscis]